MTLLKRSFAVIAAAHLLAAGIVACGEEGQTIGEGQCTDPGEQLPLYHWEFSDAGGGTWVRVGPDGKPVQVNYSGKPYLDLDNNGRCQTPPGYMTSVDQGTGGKTGTGGANNRDSGRD